MNTEIILNKEESMALKQKYIHELGDCYWNAHELFKNNEVDSIQVGYAKSKESVWIEGYYVKDFYIRHNWGIKDNQIIDSTLANEIEKYSYFPLFTIDKSNILKSMLKTKGMAFNELDVEKEVDFLLARPSISKVNIKLLAERHCAQFVDLISNRIGYNVLLE